MGLSYLGPRATATADVTTKGELDTALAAVGGTSRNVTLALALLWAHLARRGVAPLRIVGTGSSSMSGANATTRPRCFFNLTLGAIQAAWPSGTGQETTPIHNNAFAFGTLSSAPGVHGYNGAQGGVNATSFITDAERDAILQLAPQVILHMVGANDFTEGRTIAAYKADLLARVEQLRDGIPGGLQILIHSYQRFDQSSPRQWSEFGDAMREIAIANPTRVAFIDLSGDFAVAGVPGPAGGQDPLDLIDTDRVHQNDVGHSFMADLLCRALGVPRQAVAPVGAAAPADTTAPVVSSFTATAGDGQVALAWAGSDAVGITQWTVTRGGATVYQGTATSYTETGLTNGTSYAYSVTARDAAGNVSTAATASATPAAATTPPPSGGSVYASDGFGDAFTDITARQSDSAAGGTPRSYSSTFGQAFASSSGRLVRGSGTGGNFAGFAGPQNGRVEIDIVALPTSDNAYLMARRSSVSGASTYLRAGVNANGSLSADRNGSTNIAPALAAGTVKAGDRIAIDFNGTTVKVILNGVEVMSGTVATLDAAGFVGISVQNGNTVFDNLRVLAYA